MRSDNISVIIPLYRKRDTIGAALSSVLAQTLAPLEIIVVDDGSDDGSAEIVESFTSPMIRLLRQSNAGVSAARNRAMREAAGEWVALLDADDEWMPQYLQHVSRAIHEFPQCRAFGSGFFVRDQKGRVVPGRTPDRRGPVDFFAESMSRYVLIPSAALLHRQTALECGGFPEGMKLGEDQYLWTLMARRASVGFLPERLVIYSRGAQNNSAATYTPEKSDYSLEQLYGPQYSDISNEYVARVALGKALVISTRGGTAEARRTARFFAGTRQNRFALAKLRILNALPASWRPAAMRLYNRLAWLIAKKGMS